MTSQDYQILIFSNLGLFKMLENLYLLIFNDIIILAAETPLSVLEALWKNPLEGVSYHSSLIVPASLKALRRSSSIVLNPGFLQNI